MFMTHSIAPVEAPRAHLKQVENGLVQSLRGSLASLACKCSTKDNADYLIKEDRIVCAFCGREVFCVPPIMGVFKATCSCCSSPSIKTTFVLDSRGIYSCTWCSRTR